ncbi:MAG: hypothetical protein R3C11_09700 [Planctomycetaceae bacterium]
MSTDSLLELFLEHSSTAERSELPGPLVDSFGDSNAEWQAMCEGSVLFDLSGSFAFRLKGSARSRFLNNFCTNNISQLQPGMGCEAFITTVKGRVLAHLYVICEPESLLLFSLGGGSRELREHLQKYILLDDVQIEELGESILSFTSPVHSGAPDKIEEWTDQTISRWQSVEVVKFGKEFAIQCASMCSMLQVIFSSFRKMMQLNSGKI